MLKDTSCLVDNLNNGGIRFVYFSSENELKSKVSEKAGKSHLMSFVPSTVRVQELKPATEICH